MWIVRQQMLNFKCKNYVVLSEAEEKMGRLEQWDDVISILK